LLRSISLQETLQVIKVVVQMVEERVVAEQPELREAVLTYSREIAFSAADVYARAAEARGLWDARLEALVVDSIISGETSQEISSRVAALGWRADGQTAVLLGSTPLSPDPDAIRKLTRKAGADVLIGIQGRRQVAVIGLIEPASNPEELILSVAAKLEGLFGDTALVLGSVVGAVSDANRSARSALSAYAVAAAVEERPRPILADDLLPERSMAGDPLAKAQLIDRFYSPLASEFPELLVTLRAFLDGGRSLEACSKKLFVHANTVRYRLKRVLDEVGLDPTEPRSAFVLQIALLLGAINDAESGLRR
jgi:sugar diacid utilization regulator